MRTVEVFYEFARNDIRHDTFPARHVLTDSAGVTIPTLIGNQEADAQDYPPGWKEGDPIPTYTVALDWKFVPWQRVLSVEWKGEYE